MPKGLKPEVNYLGLSAQGVAGRIDEDDPEPMDDSRMAGFGKRLLVDVDLLARRPAVRK